MSENLRSPFLLEHDKGCIHLGFRIFFFEKFLQFSREKNPKNPKDSGSFCGQNNSDKYPNNSDKFSELFGKNIFAIRRFFSEFWKIIRTVRIFCKRRNHALKLSEFRKIIRTFQIFCKRKNYTKKLSEFWKIIRTFQIFCKRKNYTKKLSEFWKIIRIFRIK